MNNNHIALESGTNEVDILEFKLGHDCYGINVLKVREVIAKSKEQAITPIPKAHPCLEGIFCVRDEIIPVVDLVKWLSYENDHAEAAHDKYIICEMNRVKVAFHVHQVTRIHSISWENIEKPSAMMKGKENAAVGIIRLQEQMILLLDFERIIGEMMPYVHAFDQQVKSLGTRKRSDKKILIVEDSTMLSALLEGTLKEAGYQQLQTFSDGKEAWEALESFAQKERLEDHVHLIITDIEMPRMDGLHLTRRVKEHPLLKRIPVVIFSSLITDDLRHKGEVVGANAQINKPEIARLVEVVDQFIQ
ncbi:chemotaxis protein [Paenibacillus aestuarii]|uniref:Chemotaxis protein n=1 Tax=Paenibacillus aestuarii TaxID=516965 RepID=A0ABW0K3B8_9BACL|nr:chemotaxis protein [Paenibacillus aestuarii]